MDFSQTAYIRIHPGMGLARVGDSPDYFIGPEAPGIVADPGDGPDGPGPDGGTYRDSEMRLKRQAQRFRVYAYAEDGTVIGEVTKEQTTLFRWRVHVRNVKAANYAFQGAYLFEPGQWRNPSINPQDETGSPEDRSDLIIDPGAVYISDEEGDVRKPLTGDIFTNSGSTYLPGYLDYDDPALCDRNPEDWVQVDFAPATDIEIARLSVDDGGRLIFIAGPGQAECVTTPAIRLSNPSEHYHAPNGPVLTGVSPNGDDASRYQALVNQFAYFNVPGWWDDTCGGEIDVTVVMRDGTVLSTRDGIGPVSTYEEPQAYKGLGTRNASRGAWVVTAPPKYAPYMYHVVTLKDRVFELFPEADPNIDKQTEFYRDVYPILSRAVNYGWVSAEAAGVTPENRNLAHGPKQAGNLLSETNIAAFANNDPDDSNAQRYAAARRQIFKLMRQADTGNADDTPDFDCNATLEDFGKLIDTLPEMPPPASALPKKVSTRTPRGNKMPKLSGTGGKPLQNQQLGNDLPNQYLSLTANDLKRMNDWACGTFVTGECPTPRPLEDIPVAEQPLAMDCAAMEPTIGGGFHPGIEFPYLICYREFFDEAFRVADTVTPGSLAAYMSSPWHGDYWSCNTAWWPVQRPDVVFEVQEDGWRTYKEWFRGYDGGGHPLSGTDGYDQMVYAWSKLGMVLPVKVADDPRTQPQTGDDCACPDESAGFATDNCSVIYQEFERDPALDRQKTPPSPVCGDDTA